MVLDDRFRGRYMPTTFDLVVRSAHLLLQDCRSCLVEKGMFQRHMLRRCTAMYLQSLHHILPSPTSMISTDQMVYQQARVPDFLVTTRLNLDDQTEF